MPSVYFLPIMTMAVPVRVGDEPVYMYAHGCVREINTSYPPLSRPLSQAFAVCLFSDTPTSKREKGWERQINKANGDSTDAVITKKEERYIIEKIALTMEALRVVISAAAYILLLQQQL